jgi:hypothetical protein
LQIGRRNCPRGFTFLLGLRSKIFCANSVRPHPQPVRISNASRRQRQAVLRPARRSGSAPAEGIFAAIARRRLREPRSVEPPNGRAAMSMASSLRQDSRNSISVLKSGCSLQAQRKCGSACTTALTRRKLNCSAQCALRKSRLLVGQSRCFWRTVPSRPRPFGDGIRAEIASRSDVTASDVKTVPYSNKQTRLSSQTICGSLGGANINGALLSRDETSP